MEKNDWPEDFHHENGNYQNLCCDCGIVFLGHKRRVQCKVCHNNHELWYNSLTPDEQKSHVAKLVALLTAYVNNLKKVS